MTIRLGIVLKLLLLSERVFTQVIPQNNSQKFQDNNAQDQFESFKERNLYIQWTDPTQIGNSCKTLCIDAKKNYCTNADMTNGICCEAGENCLKQKWCSYDNPKAPKQYQYLTCPNEAMCGTKFLQPDNQGNVLTRTVDVYGSKIMTLGDVCSYIAIAPATRTSYDRLHVRVSAISLVDVYIAKGKNYRWMPQLETVIVLNDMEFDTAGDWQLYIVGVANSIFPGTYTVETWFEKVAVPSNSNTNSNTQVQNNNQNTTTVIVQNYPTLKTPGIQQVIYYSNNTYQILYQGFIYQYYSFGDSFISSWKNPNPPSTNTTTTYNTTITTNSTLSGNNTFINNTLVTPTNTNINNNTNVAIKPVQNYQTQTDQIITIIEDAGSSNSGVIAAIIVIILILGLAVCILIMYRKGMIKLPCFKVIADIKNGNEDKNKEEQIDDTQKQNWNNTLDESDDKNDPETSKKVLMNQKTKEDSGNTNHMLIIEQNTGNPQSTMNSKDANSNRYSSVNPLLSVDHDGKGNGVRNSTVFASQNSGSTAVSSFFPQVELNTLRVAQNEQPYENMNKINVLMVPLDKSKSQKDPQDSDWNRKESEGQTPGQIVLDDDAENKVAPFKLQNAQNFMSLDKSPAITLDHFPNINGTTMGVPIFDAELVLDDKDGPTQVKPKKKKKKKLQQSIEKLVDTQGEVNALVSSIRDEKLPEIGQKTGFTLFKDENSLDQIDNMIPKKADSPDDGFEFSMFGAKDKKKK